MSYSPKRATPSSPKNESKQPSDKKPVGNMTAADKKKKNALIIAIIVILVLMIAVSLLFIIAPADGDIVGGSIYTDSNGTLIKISKNSDKKTNANGRK